MVTIESGYVNPLDFMAMLATIGVTIILPWTPLGTLLGFQLLPLSFVLVLGASAVVRYCCRECETSVLSTSEILVVKRSTYDFRQQRNVTVMF
jgi:hypothetical protein